MVAMKIAVFCGASPGKRPEYIKAAEQLASSFVSANVTLVYGGANIGLMGVLADHMLKLGGKVIGVVAEVILKKEIAHPKLTQLHIVPTMHERKVLMIELADSFITMPGGAGSLDELFEVFTLAQLGLHQKSFGIL